MQDVVLVGGGGHCRSCIDVIECEGKLRIVGIVDVRERLDSSVSDYPVRWTDENLEALAAQHGYFLITLGQILSPEKRVHLFEHLQQHGARFPVVVSRRAYVSPRARVGEGTIIMHDACVNAGAAVGRNCIINSKALVEHDATVEDHCHISTAAVLNGGVIVRSRTFIGSNAVTRETVEIGADSVVGAGIRVMRSLPPRSFVRQ